MIKNEICLYHSKLTDPYKVYFIQSSSESPTSLVWSPPHERGVWVLTKQLEATGELREAVQEESKPKRWTIGEDVPESARKKKGVRK